MSQQHQTTTPAAQTKQWMHMRDQMAAEVMDVFRHDADAQKIKNNAERLRYAMAKVRIPMYASYKNVRQLAKSPDRKVRTLNAIFREAGRQLTNEWYSSTRTGGSGTYPINDKDTTAKSYTDVPQVSPNAKNINLPDPSHFETTGECVTAISQPPYNLDRDPALFSQ